MRYQGTHPKNYQEKYKELQPEKYPETVARVIEKGGTPVGMHISICVNEILEFLQIKPGQKGLDATLGYGGHTHEMLKRLQGQGHIYALDVDAIEMAKTRERLADLGVSSMQIDNPKRGFTYKKNGPLDLRLNPQRGIAAAERLRDISQEGLQRTFQALRIDVNNEYEVLYQLLEKLPEVLAPGGRVAILTFHSGEDRLVKKSFKRLKREGIYSDIADEVIRPSAEECSRNSRARSTKMRWAVKY